MDIPSSSFSLRMLNLMIGLCKGAKGLPSDLRDLGFICKWIELPFMTSTGRRVKPDAILCSELLSYTWLTEWKSGPNVEPDQLNRYESVTGEDLQSRAYVTRNAASTHDTAIFGQLDHAERLKMGLEMADCRYPLVICDPKGLERVKGEFQEGSLNLLFGPRFDVETDLAPVSYVPFDVESPPADIAYYCIPKVLQMMHESTPHIVLDELAARTIRTWSSVSSETQGQLMGKVKQVMNLAADGPFKIYWRRNKRLSSVRKSYTWEITSNPLQSSPDKRTAAWQTLRAAQKAFVAQLRARAAQPELPLFD